MGFFGGSIVDFVLQKIPQFLRASINIFVLILVCCVVLILVCCVVLIGLSAQRLTLIKSFILHFCLFILILNWVILHLIRLETLDIWLFLRGFNLEVSLLRFVVFEQFIRFYSIFLTLGRVCHLLDLRFIFVLNLVYLVFHLKNLLPNLFAVKVVNWRLILRLLFKLFLNFYHQRILLLILNIFFF
jgi:hypothetical protein